MSEQVLATASVQPVKSVSKVWLIPVVAILIGCWMIYYQWSNQGPEITIAFTTAEGMEAGKTKIKSRNVDIGEVRKIELNANGNGVIVTARIAKSAERLLVADSLFWVVSPQISHTGVSGLSTLISGVYIEISPGESSEELYEFTALDSPPVTPLGTPGLHITLNSNDQFAYEKGDPVIYKGLTVGQFEDIYFNFDERIVYYNVFVKAPYHKLLTTNTKFWDVSGINLDLNSDGISVKTGNFETILTNGVTFDVPDGMELGDIIGERSYFDIYKNYQAASDERYRHSANFIILVSDSIRGLKVGAPVEYRGVQIGKVLSTNVAEFNRSDKLIEHDYKIPVLISVQPGRVGLPDNIEGVEIMAQQNIHWIKQGLKAVLRTGNLLTGSLFVDLLHIEDQPVTEISYFNNYPVFPSSGNEFSQLTAKAERFMDSLNSIPLADLSDNAGQLLQQVANTAKELQQVSQTLNKVLTEVEQEQLGAELSKTLQGINQLTQDFSEGSQSYEDLRRTLNTLTTTLNELKPLLNQLNNKPNSLIFNSGHTSEPSPQKYNGEQ